MKLYTVVSDYFATGEGRTQSAVVVWAEDEVEALKKFEREIYGGEFYGQDAEVIEGVAYDNPIMVRFMSPYLKEFFESQQVKRCNLVWSQRFHFNYS